MERFCQMTPEELDLLVSLDGIELDDAVYPPQCEPTRGPLRIRAHDRGGIKLEVSPRRLPYDDFALSVLFHSGSCIFGGAEHLARFFRGPVATAFGIECDPLPVAVEPRPCASAVDPAPRPRRRKHTRSSLPSADALHSALALRVHGQDSALARIARVVTTQLAKNKPARPETLLLIGPTGTGKTSAIEALPEALRALGRPGMHVYRVDCGELVSASDIRRILGAPPSYIGYVEEPPLVAALREPGCILLLDEIEKADGAVHDVFLGLLDEGRITAPDGETVEARGIVVAFTTNLDAEDLAFRLRDVSGGSREEQLTSREHLLRSGWPPELVGRIGTVAVFDELTEESRRGVATNAIHELAGEYGLTIEELPGVLVDVVRDLADASEIGARAVTYAARDLLAEALADAARKGVTGLARLDPGPPPRVVQTTPS